MDGVPFLSQPPNQCPAATFEFNEFTPPDAGLFWYTRTWTALSNLAKALVGALIVDEAEKTRLRYWSGTLSENWHIKDDGSFTALTNTTKFAFRYGKRPGRVHDINRCNAPTTYVPAGGAIVCVYWTSDNIGYNDVTSNGFWMPSIIANWR